MAEGRQRWTAGAARYRFRRRFRREPQIPTLPRGTTGSPPDFVGVGTQRSATSWWWWLLTEHPGVAPNAGGRKELHFFDRFFAGSPSVDDFSAYQRYFPRGSDGSDGHPIVGEWTPRYMHDPWTPPLLRRVAPEARLLVMLRDPVDRYQSGITHTAALNLRAPTRDDANDAFARGCYFRQLGWLSSSYPIEQILVLQYERCLVSTVEQLARTFAFLGLAEADFVPARLSAPPWAGLALAGPKVPIDRDLRASLQNAYRFEVDALLDAYPDIDRALWKNFS
jgi:hypothetical protein